MIFFLEWHRNYIYEFGIDTTPLFNMFCETDIEDILATNEAEIQRICQLDLREYLKGNNVIRHDVLGSIPNELLLEKAFKKFTRVMKISDEDKVILNQLEAKKILLQLAVQVGTELNSIQDFPTKAYTDEIFYALQRLSKFLGLKCSFSLKSKNESSRFKLYYCPRNYSYLRLGRDCRDCTSDKSNLQTFQTENIYWTIFSWLFDKNYQILKVVKQEEEREVLIAKVHLTPLYINDSINGNEFFFLCLDAIETRKSKKRGFLDFLPEEIFSLIIEKVLSIADAMGIDIVLAEKFSNTDWVRERLSEYPDKYLDTRNIVKIDGLEDVFECANRFCNQNMSEGIEHIFMEIQAKNTHLMPDSPAFLKGYCKSFALLRGRNVNSIPMNRLFGV